ncbi:hypothetical protein ACJX0J_029107, partial [Zea mays]
SSLLPPICAKTRFLFKNPSLSSMQGLVSFLHSPPRSRAHSHRRTMLPLPSGRGNCYSYDLTFLGSCFAQYVVVISAFADGLYVYTLTGLTSKSRESYANTGVLPPSPPSTWAVETHQGKV